MSVEAKPEGKPDWKDLQARLADVRYCIAAVKQHRKALDVDTMQAIDMTLIEVAAMAPGDDCAAVRRAIEVLRAEYLALGCEVAQS